MRSATLSLFLMLLSLFPAVASAVPENITTTAVSSSIEATENAPENMKCGYFDCIPLEPLVDDVIYTVRERLSATAQASKWGVPSNVFLMLNTELKPDTMLTPGQKYIVDARIASEAVPYSSGKCNRGRLFHARLMPEIEGSLMRRLRPNSWGTDTTIQALTTLFKAYHEAYPDAMPINLGDISRRRGGRLKPHKSHQSGRDVDLGFIHIIPPEEQRDPEDPKSDRFIRANATNLDLEKTWFMVETLVRTGTVKVIYVDKSIIKMLYNHVSERLTPEQRAFFFSTPRHPASSSAILQHWPGHKNHFHIRFICPPDQPGCRN